MSDLWRTSLDLHGRPAAPILWTSAAPPSDRPALRRWRRGVGPVRLARAPAAGAGPDAGAATWPLVVAAWNAGVGAGDLGALWERVVRGVPGAAAAPAAPAPDAPAPAAILLLQEVFATFAVPTPTGPAAARAERIAGAPPGGGRTDIAAFARRAGLSLLYVPSMGNGAPDGTATEDRGNAILANVPLSRPRAIELPFERQRRVAVAATAAIGGREVHACSVHLDNRAPWRRAWRGLGAGRRRQMAALLGALPGAEPAAAAAPPPAAVHALGGDLNTWVRGRREAAWRLARKRFPLPREPDRAPTHHFEIGGWLRHSDHLMFRLPPGLREGSALECGYRRLDDTFGSDHYPLLGEVRARPGRPCRSRQGRAL